MTEGGSARWRVVLAFGAVALFTGLAAWPGLRGDWVGDDFHMVSSPLYGDWGEVFRVFSRHAGHYLGGTPDPSLASPYRPFTMFTLLLPHALVPEPWLHHLVSWLMHLATGCLLLAALLRQTPPARHPAAASVSLVLASLFLLHPTAVEAYVFINGRSDLVAGLFLAALATVLLDGSLSRRTRTVLGTMLVFLGTASKMTFVPAAVALWLGLSLRSERPGQSLRAGLPFGGAVLAYLALRASNAPFVGRLGATDNIAHDLSAFAELPQLLAKSVAALVTFRAEAMQSLAWQLFQPFSGIEWLGGLVFVAAVVVLAVRRDSGGVVLVLGVALTIAPCVMVSRAFWLGFDRYLYMPSILAALALGPHLVAAVEATPRHRVLWASVGGALVLLAALGTRTSSMVYINQTTFETAITNDHPDDPTMVYYMALSANKSGGSEDARTWLARMPEPPWPAAIVAGTIDLADELDDPRVYAMAVEYRDAIAVTE